MIKNNTCLLRKKHQRGCHTSIGFIPCNICGVETIPASAWTSVAEDIAMEIDKDIIKGMNDNTKLGS